MRTLQPLEAHELGTLACPWCGRVATRASLGFKVTRGSDVLGAITVAPPEGEVGLCPQASLLITSLWVREGDQLEHIGTQLVQRAAAHALGRSVRCLVVGGSHGVPSCTRPPAGWLEHVGFVEHVAGVQWRLDLRRTAPITGWLRQVSDAVAQHLSPGRPAPANRE